MIKSKQGNVFWGRTMEYFDNFRYTGCFIPRNYEIKDTITPFETKYEVLGVGIEQIPYVVADGVNEKGLTGASFFFANYAQYCHEDEVKDSSRIPLAGAEFVPYALTNYASVEEIRQKANDEIVIVKSDKPTGLPLHFIFQDETGDSIAVEPSKKRRTSYS